MTMTTLAPVEPFVVHDRHDTEHEVYDPWLEWDGMAGYYTKRDLPDLIAEFGEDDSRVEALQESRDGTYIDQDDYDSEWETLLEELTEWMKEVTPKEAYYGYWQAYVHNQGWLHRNGEKTFPAKDGQHLLWAILSDPNSHFKIYKCEDATGRQGLAFNAANHDSPMWGEWYYVFAEVEVEEGEESDD